MYDFSDQTVIVTGASGNLGVAVVNNFQASGANLVLVDRGTGRLQSLYPDIQGSRAHFLAEGIDVTEAEAVEKMVNQTIERFGHIDVLVNTVGGYRGGTPVSETSLETWEFLFKLNALPAFILSRAVIPHMLRARRGKIIHVAARAATQGGGKMAIYSAAKSAVVRLTEGLATEIKDDGINVNCILPGTIDTPQNRRDTPNADYSRWVQPEAIADVVHFLASDASRAINGASIPIYGRS
ncbi:MAG: hypothetical protein A2Z45_06150 [Chloroflexi bacterium RBG_19FT_COMBO_55_16]|nr:MAG: hypothetical protein A2Z45_06150 [Chloroflexi bacterium RBG_19FT_COMBO_55_16]